MKDKESSISISKNKTGGDIIVGSQINSPSQTATQQPERQESGFTSQKFQIISAVAVVATLIAFGIAIAQLG